MTFASTLSEHPLPVTAIGEATGYILEKIGEEADLVCLFVTTPHAGALEDMCAAVRKLLKPKVLIGCAAEGVIGTGREVEDSAAVALWAGNVGPVAPVRLEVVDNPSGGKAIGGWPIDLGWVPAGAVLIADPYSFPVNALFDKLNGAGGFPRVTGGMASGAKGPGGNRIVLNDEVYTDGAVGVLIGANDEVWLENIVTQGCKPIGSPFVATRVEGNVVCELAGEPALKRLTEMVKKELSDEDAARAQDGLLVGLVIDEHKSSFEPGDFVIRTFMDADPMTGSLTIGEKIEVGTTLQFHLRDPELAHIELESALSERDAVGGGRGVLLFSGSGRGRSLFDLPDHDADVVAIALDDPPTAGFFTAGEFGPVAGRNLVHGFSASMALFANRKRE